MLIQWNRRTRYSSLACHFQLILLIFCERRLDVNQSGKYPVIPFIRSSCLSRTYLLLLLAAFCNRGGADLQLSSHADHGGQQGSFVLMLWLFIVIPLFCAGKSGAWIPSALEFQTPPKNHRPADNSFVEFRKVFEDLARPQIFYWPPAARLLEHARPGEKHPKITSGNHIYKHLGSAILMVFF